MHTLRIVPVALTLVAAAAAQIPIVQLPTRGMMSSYPAGVMSPSGEILKKPAGLPVIASALQPLNPPAPIAQYSVQTIMTWLRGQNPQTANVTTIAMDAFTSGNDTLPLLLNVSSGKYWVGKGMTSGWAVLCMTIQGIAPQGSAVMGYYFDNPSFPQQLRNGMYYEFLPTDFPSNNLPAEWDIAMGLLDDPHGLLEVGDHPEIHHLYFSLTPTSAQLLYNELLAASALLQHTPGVTYVLPSGPQYYTGATIFDAEFGLDGACSSVRVCEDWLTLGVGPNDDVDALAVAWAGQPSPTDGFETLAPGTLQYVFSLSVGGGPQELLVAANVGTTAPGTRKQGPLLGGHGEEILGGGGSMQWQVNGLCARDPHGAGQGGFGGGEPVRQGDPGLANGLSLSLAAQTTNASPFPTDQFTLTGVLSGWGGQTPENSLFWLRMEIVGGQLNTYTVYFGPWSRAATEGYKTFTQPLPYPQTFPYMPWLGTCPDAQNPDWTYTVSNANRLRFSVYQAGLSQTQPPTESFRSLFFRHQ